jgi:hypothetical protein
MRPRINSKKKTGFGGGLAGLNSMTEQKGLIEALDLLDLYNGYPD